jgi:hypothetical protein
VAVDLGERVVGVRSNDAATVDLLRRVLAPMALDGVDVFPNVSVLVGEAHGRTRPLHRLWRRRQVVLATPSPGHVLRAALHALDTLISPSPELLPLRGGFVVGPGGAVLLHPTTLPGHVSDRRLARGGWRRGGGHVPLLDRRTFELVVPASRLTLDPDGLAELDRRFPLGPGQGPPRPGRYPLRAVVLLGAQPAGQAPLTATERLAAVTELVPLGARRGEEVLTVTDALRGCDILTPTGTTGDALLASLREVVGAAEGDDGA